MKNWLLTLGALFLFALLFAGVNIGLILLSLGALISVAMAIVERIDKKNKKHEEG